MEEMRPYPSSVRSRMRGYKEVLKGISKKMHRNFIFPDKSLPLLLFFFASNFGGLSENIPKTLIFNIIYHEKRKYY